MPRIYECSSAIIAQDEDFVLDKDDGGSPTDDSDEDESDASDSGEEKEVTGWLDFVFSPELRIYYWEPDFVV